MQPDVFRDSIQKAQEFGEILRLPYFAATADTAGIALHDGDLPLLFY